MKPEACVCQDEFRMRPKESWTLGDAGDDTRMGGGRGKQRQKSAASVRPPWWSLGCAVLLPGCVLGPDYQRPDMDTPPGFRSASGEVSSARSLADLGWSELTSDRVLRGYLNEALDNSWDIQAAAARVMQAEAALQSTGSRFLPTISLGGGLLTTRTSEEGPTGALSDPQQEFGEVYVALSAYEVDLWGRIRRANEAARARLLATQAAQDTVRQTLLTDVASTYLFLLQLDQDLETSRRTLASHNDSLVLTTTRQEGGVASLQDVAQARILVSTAEASITDTLRQIEQTENALAVLLGRNPGRVARGRPLCEQPLRSEAPPGLPSDLLLRRPDLRAAEQELVAANADVGQAKAAFFPQVTLTGLYGFQSVSLSELFTQPARTWEFGPAVSAPVFTGGLLKGNLKLAQARFQEAVALYQKSVQEAFRDVSDSLIAYERSGELRAQLTERVEAHRLAASLATTRYEGGVTSYLEVLYIEQELFDAELALSRAQVNELLSVIQLYRALGGGWR